MIFLVNEFLVTVSVITVFDKKSVIGMYKDDELYEKMFHYNSNVCDSIIFLRAYASTSPIL